MLNYTISDDAAAVASVRKMNGKDAMEVLRFALALMLVPAAATIAYLLTSVM